MLPWGTKIAVPHCRSLQAIKARGSTIGVGKLTVNCQSRPLSGTIPLAPRTFLSATLIHHAPTPCTATSPPPGCLRLPFVFHSYAGRCLSYSTPNQIVSHSVLSRRGVTFGHGACPQAGPPLRFFSSQFVKFLVAFSTPNK
jgi:hypothetical protein